MSPTSQSPSAIFSSTSVSEPKILGSLAIQRRSIRSVAARPSFASRSATNETLYSLVPDRRQSLPFQRGSPRPS